MSGTRRNRRSKRVPGTHRLLLTILGPTGLEIAKEIVSTVELSQYGARVRGRRSLRPESEGVLTQLRSGRQARIRIAWQRKCSESAEFFDTGVELLSGFDYWGDSFADPHASVRDAVPGSAGVAPLTTLELLGELKEELSGDAGARSMELLWCGLVEQLEVNKVFTRDELIAAIRSIAQARANEGA